MRVTLRGVGKGHPLTGEVSLSYRSGHAVLASVETEQRPTVLGLLASGRMRPDRGIIVVNGERDPKTLRRLVALVDAPDVSEPEPNVTVAGVVCEELMFAGKRSDPFAARRWLSDHGFAGLSGQPMSNVPADERVRMLCELAAQRPGVEGLVIVSPDRHGGYPRDWWAVAQDFAARGMAVLVLAGRASLALLAPEEDAVQHTVEIYDPDVAGESPLAIDESPTGERVPVEDDAATEATTERDGPPIDDPAIDDPAHERPAGTEPDAVDETDDAHDETNDEAEDTTAAEDDTPSEPEPAAPTPAPEPTPDTAQPETEQDREEPRA